LEWTATDRAAANADGWDYDGTTFAPVRFSADRPTQHRFSNLNELDTYLQHCVLMRSLLHTKAVFMCDSEYRNLILPGLGPLSRMVLWLEISRAHDIARP
jgi:hypothetical protein